MFESKDGLFRALIEDRCRQVMQGVQTPGRQPDLRETLGAIAERLYALVMSEDPERKVALVDANFRSPRAADLFNLDKGRGLLSAIAGQRSLSECVARVLGRNLIVLHAGGEHKNPAQILSDPKFKTLITELSQAIDFMIIDAPCAVPYADVPLLAQHADAVFMVVGARETKRSDLDKALDTIGRNRVVGSIFRDHIKGKK
jgi:Mrp family chromosome partitioning ATPase